MSKFTVFFGGSIGYDPQSPATWSGVGSFLLAAMRGAGNLDRAIGIRVPYLYSGFLLTKNVNRDRGVWRAHYYFDQAYREALTKAASRVSVSNPILLQIGHMFSLPHAFPQKICVSYHDGNLAEKIRSGFGLEGVSRQRIDEALRYEEDVSAQMTAIFTFSEYLRQSFISDYHVPGERVFNVGGGVNLNEFPSTNPHKDYTAPRILFIGTDFVRKGGLELLKAFCLLRAALPAAELHIVGPEKKLQHLPSGVVFHGRLSKSDPAQNKRLELLFRTSSLFVLPSIYEPFGIAPLEAMLYQVPCLVTDGWAFRETVIPGFNGDLVSKGSVDGIATKLLALLSDPERLASMGRHGRDLVLQSYTWPSVAERMSSAIRSLEGREATWNTEVDTPKAAAGLVRSGR